tara:strand:+ start:3692 stop:3931 length:240 start_codon:yes stop_codon:yes gene_type:complete
MRDVHVLVYGRVQTQHLLGHGVIDSIASTEKDDTEDEGDIVGEDAEPTGNIGRIDVVTDLGHTKTRRVVLRCIDLAKRS